MRSRTLMIVLACAILLAALFAEVRPVSAQEGPAVTARDVVDRDTLKALVQGAIGWLRAQFESGEAVDIDALKTVFRMDPGPWKHGSTYFVVLVNDYLGIDGAVLVFFDAGNPENEFKLLTVIEDASVVKVMQDLVAAAVENAPMMEGGFVEYEEAGVSRVSYAQLVVAPENAGTIANAELVISAGFTPGDVSTPPDAMTTMTTFVPVVLDSTGKNNSHFTSELALTNRGSEAAMLNFTYTAEAGGPREPATATDMLGPHQQMIASNAIEYLRGLEVPIPETGSRVGTLRVDVSGSSDVSAVVRTTTPTAVPEGRAGLAYLGVPENEGFHEEVVYLCGLRDNPGDRSNVAVQNMGSEGSITVRITAFSGNPTDPSGEVAWEDTLGPGEFHQVNAVLTGAGKADPMFGGYVKVERVEGMAPFYAYGVINDNANSDGSFVFPVSAGSLMGAMGQTLPAIVESGAFTTELTLTNFSDQPKQVMFSATHERIETPDNTAGFGPVPMLPGQQLIIPHALAYARQNLGLNVPVGLVAPLIASPMAGDLSGIVIGARVVAQADAEDMTKGQYGVFYTAVPQGMGFTGEAWVDGLQQNQENRSNLALINTGEVDDQDIVFEIDIYDGETATLSKTVTMAEEDKLVVPAKGFKQINQVLKHAPGTTQGYIKIRKAMGTSANPYLAYGVVNDGGSPGQRTGDGAYIPARE